MMGYDSWKTQTPPEYEWGTPARGGCSVCGTGDGVCSESCAATARIVRARREIRGLHVAMRSALALVRRYRAERQALADAGIPVQDARINVTMSQVRRWREQASALRAEIRELRPRAQEAK